MQAIGNEDRIGDDKLKMTNDKSFELRVRLTLKPKVKMSLVMKFHTSDLASGAHPGNLIASCESSCCSDAPGLSSLNIKLGWMSWLC